MTRVRQVLGGWLLAFAMLALVAASIGCSSTESQNLSERPWNAPKSWENGLPSQMFEGR
jgi:hypothetical protein